MPNQLDSTSIRFRARDVREALEAAHELRALVLNLAELRGHDDHQVEMLMGACCALEYRLPRASDALHQLTAAAVVQASILDTEGFDCQFRRLSEAPASSRRSS